MADKLIYLLVIILLVVPLYPKFPLIGVAGTFVAIRLEDIVIAVVVGLWLATNLTKWKQVIWGQPINRAIIFYWLAGAVSIFAAVLVTKSADLNQGLLHLFRRVEYMSLFMVAYSALAKKEHLDWILRTLLIIALIVAVYGIGQLLLDWPVISTNNSEFSKGLALSLGPGARINSTFAGHYDLAAFSLFPLLVVIGMLAVKDIKGKLVVVGVGALSYWAMLLSASRVTFAAFFAASGLLLWRIGKKSWLIVWLVVALTSFWLSPSLVGRYRDLIVNQLFTWAPSVQAQADAEIPDALQPPAQPEDRSLNIRLRVEWPRAVRSVIKNPILGTGFSSVGLAVDNDYLRSMAEVGLLGTAALVLVFGRVFKALWSTGKIKMELGQIFPLAVACALIGLLINALFIDVLEASKVAIMTWTLLGLAVKTREISRS
ncbi:MAG: O-antigen ligase family protein [bacterium]|nr:O-antigen ligase family protein [bacterium]